MIRICSLICMLAFAAWAPAADEKIFSGPQPGEKLAPFKVRGVFDDDAGKDLDFVTKAGNKPILLVFVHDVNRPSIGMARAVMNYGVSRAKDLVSGTVWLTDDATEAENNLKRMRHALAKDAAIGISLDGKEGPGKYGLNRNVTLTILVGKEGKVTANFALVQPSLEADFPKILKAVVDAAGGEVPNARQIAELTGAKDRPAAKEADAKLPGMLRALIQLKATPDEVERAAKAIEEYVKESEPARKELARITKTIVEAGKVENYGTARAQEYLRKWAKEYGAVKTEEPPKK